MFRLGWPWWEAAPVSVLPVCVLPVCVLACVLLACGSTEPPSSDLAPSVEPVEAVERSYPDSDYGRALRDSDVRLADLRTRLDTPGALHRQAYVAALLDRARLVGGVTDYAAALAALEDLQAQLPREQWPHSIAAGVYASVHRLDAAEDALDGAQRRILGANHAAIAAARGDLYLHRGLFEVAHALFEESEQRSPHGGAASHVAYYHWQLGDYAAADAELDRLTLLRGRHLAYLEFTRGMLDFAQGRHGEALAHYEAADDAFSGWPLVWEHMAEVHQAEGRLFLAEALYRRVVELTESPSAMTMLALCVDADEAAYWLRRAEQLHRRDLELLPEASAGHALDYFLHHGDPAEALDLAIRNHGLRPGGEATVKFAQALCNDGAWHLAAARLDRLHATTPFRSPESLATAALAHRQQGGEARAAELESEANQLHPDAISLVAWLTP